jgi:hypothetical protein
MPPLWGNLRLPIACLLAASVAVLAGCGSSGGGTVTTSSVKSLTIAPTAPSVAVGQSISFSASESVQWSAASGTVNPATGTTTTYTAPNTAVPDTVTAKRTSDNDTKSATVTVVPALTINPPAAVVSVGQTAAFQLQVKGASPTGVTWALASGGAGGSIQQDAANPTKATYTAPTTLGAVNTDTIVVQANGQTAQATVIVQAAGGSITIQ